MQKTVTKLYLGRLVSVRSYDLHKCRELKQDLVIEHNGQIMTVPYQKLHTGKHQTKNQLSRFGNKVYDLVDFVWWPDKHQPPKQQQLTLL